MSALKAHDRTREESLATYSQIARAELAAQDGRPAGSRKWLTYGAAASAALVGSSQMDTHAVYAALQYSGVQNIMISGTSGNLGPNNLPWTHPLDLDGDGNEDFRFGAFASAETNGGSSLTGGATAGFTVFDPNGNNVVMTQANTGTFTTVGGHQSIDQFGARALASGSLVGTGSNIVGRSNAEISNQQVIASAGGGILDGTAWNTGFSGPDGGFLGVQFDTNNGAGADRFGWIRIKVDQVDLNNASINDKLTIVDWAWDDSGDHIAAGAVVPEPGSAMLMGLGTLALGAIGVHSTRKRRKEQLAKAEETETAAV